MWPALARRGPLRRKQRYEVNYVIDNAWSYRDYVIRSFNEDKRFDRFVMEQLAGDAVAPGDPNAEVGLTFLLCGPFDVVGNKDPVQAAQIRADSLDEIIRATSEAILGLTVGCARCHDHKFDPITQRDYYSLYATFAGVFHLDGGGEIKKPNAQTHSVPGGYFEQPSPHQHVFERGDCQRKAEEVVPASMSTLANSMKGYTLLPDAPEAERR